MISLKKLPLWYTLALYAFGFAVCTPSALEAAKKIIIITMKGCPPCQNLKGQIGELQKRAGTGVVVEVYDKDDTRVRHMNLSGGFPMIIVEVDGHRKKVIHGFSNINKLWSEIAPYLQ